ncbi:MAG: 4-(cytidine 5'-diphospho)-2-C-methyl-D-erythritol kinase, partial [Candidatus Dadabacteria bacterium]|nr:4-(cytidine 5'-diphospho)-2-C-methyl-D-erythritol kinase [Candidatus Dadabacteria bacterium]NIT13960.1 4-(cytidine 5'-diphospho)-2-C-methyl-D-erythritol kinase [Candidatus Dadabacteria bacterium]
METITLLSPAKINLILEITGRRTDGYHTLRSIIQPVDLFDELTLTVYSGKGIEIEADGLKLTDNKENLISSSAEAYLREAGISA